MCCGGFAWDARDGRACEWGTSTDGCDGRTFYGLRCLLGLKQFHHEATRSGHYELTGRVVL